MSAPESRSLTLAEFRAQFKQTTEHGIYIDNASMGPVAPAVTQAMADCMQLRQTMPLEQALIEAGTTRLRPILMTTLTTIISMIPMIFTTSPNLVMMKEMSYIVIGGLIASTVLAMFLVPPFYLLMRGERVDGSKRPPLFKKKNREKGPVEAALSAAGSNADET